MMAKGMGSFVYGKKPDSQAVKQPQPPQQTEPQVMPLTSENLNKLEKNPYHQQPQQQQQEQPSPGVDIDAFSYDELNSLLHKISTSLVSADRTKLSKWIAGTQQGFAILLVWSAKL